MTILTKPFGDKKPEKLAVPLVSEGSPSAPVDTIHDPESDPHGATLHLRRRSIPTVVLLLVALFVMGIGIIGGVYVYREYAHSKMQRLRFHGFCGVPYDSTTMDDSSMMFLNSKLRGLQNDDVLVDGNSVDLFDQLTNEMTNQYFREEFELDLSDDESYSKITVPDFRDGRQGRFLHDFNNNQSSIIDMDKNRCFVMPLDRETVLQPRSLLDLITKMYNGYYNIDTTVVRQDYRVILPAVTDITLVSDRIANECRGMNIYMLEKYVQGVYKRSIAESLPSSGKFAEFSGYKIVHFNIVNVGDLDPINNSH